MNTHRSFEAVVNLVREKHSRLDLVLVTGDVAQDGSVAAYRQFAELIATLDVPWHWIPGNHDNPGSMQIAVPCTTANDRVIRLGNWLFLLLDTAVEAQEYGLLAPKEIGFLKRELRVANTDTTVAHCLVALHHNPVDTSAKWMQDIGLHHRYSLWQQLRHTDKLRCLIYGHVHQAQECIHDGIHCLSAPSTCFQFKPDVTKFTLDRLNPGYRHLQLYQDGSVKTKVYRIADRHFGAEYKTSDRSTGE